MRLGYSNSFPYKMADVVENLYFLALRLNSAGLLKTKDSDFGINVSLSNNEGAHIIRLFLF